MDEHARMEIEPVASVSAEPIPAFSGGQVPGDLREAIGRAVAAWRDRLSAAGQTNSTIRRKLTALRSLFS